jgi:8-oxo-dGTP diphosphatase
MKEHMQDAIRAAVIIEKDQKFLLVKEGTPKVFGLWNWQQGKVEDGETPEQAAVREAKEETGFIISIKRKITVIENPFPGTKEIHVFLGDITDGELHVPEAEIVEAKWFTRDEVESIKDQMPGPWVFDTISSL